GYAPLMRFGQYKLNITDRATGQTLFFGLYESKAAANAALRDMQGDPTFEGADFEQGVLSQEQYKLFSSMPLDSLEMFAEAIGADQSDVYQDFIRLAKSNRSAMKRLLKRKGTAGFSEDVPRVLAAFVTSNARMAAGALNMPTAKEAAQNIRDGDVQDEAIKLLDVVQNPTDTAGAVRGLMFVNFIGGSIASAVVNLTQPLTMTLPYLSQFGGGMKAAKRLMAAGKMAASGKVDDLALREALKRAETDGIVSPQEIHHLTSQAMGTLGTHPLLQRAAFIWGAPFSLAEQFNRRVSFIAAFNTAREQGIEDPFSFAEKAVIETQGLYNKGNAPNLARGTIGAAALTFKQFSIHYLEWMGRMWKSGPEGKKAVGLALALLILAAGTDGLPFADDLDDLIDTLGQALGYDMNVKRARREFVAEQLGLGDGAADVMARGFSAVPGIPLDVSIRMSMGNLVPGTGMFLRSNTDKSRDLLEIAGPAGGLAKQYIEAGTKALQGDVGGAVQSALPVAFQNAFKGVGMWTTGEARDTLGRKVMDADEVDGLMKFIGFQPQAIARESEKIQMIRNSEQLAKNVEGEIASAWARAIVDKDPDGVADARAKLAQWNEDNPEAPIRIKMQQIISRARKLREDRASRFITSVSPERRRAVAEALE
ncbi:MAG TPA: PLxRFG domain-containing protein, partial [Burkholderiaceae bacterium]|nr:PLxRFG domain-containing protein [Burkholderiaceae bacterium]